jgi:hypothetical protein
MLPKRSSKPRKTLSNISFRPTPKGRKTLKRKMQGVLLHWLLKIGGSLENLSQIPAI